MCGPATVPPHAVVASTVVQTLACKLMESQLVPAAQTDVAKKLNEGAPHCVGDALQEHEQMAA
jgi:hypothetical protein